jgi:hypothetical protein
VLDHGAFVAAGVPAIVDVGEAATVATGIGHARSLSRCAGRGRP